MVTNKKFQSGDEIRTRDYSGRYRVVRVWDKYYDCWDYDLNRMQNMMLSEVVDMYCCNITKLDKVLA